ncbi:Bro-N domain-containing protein [Paremcibacter congregatus]|uniref:BRO-N domain-containing protein n=1 Tax=Paremcibacter congregatus TaxID=2043170 RepID=UPI003A926302
MTKRRNEVITHTFNDTHKIRTITLEGEPWFVAVDACKALGVINSGSAYSRLGVSEKSNIRRMDVGGYHGAGRDLVILSESGLYKLIMRSDKPTAKPFQDWVTKEVLPSIRKTGGYNPTPVQTPPMVGRCIKMFDRSRQPMHEPADFTSSLKGPLLRYLELPMSPDKSFSVLGCAVA